MSVYRAVVIPLYNLDCNVRRLMALTNLAYRGFIFKVPDLPATAFHELKSWAYRGVFNFGASPKRWFAKTWYPMLVQRRLRGEVRGSDTSSLFVDFDSGVMRLRYVCHTRLPIPNWLYERMAEGGEIKIAYLGLKYGKPHLAIVVERPYAPVEPSGYLLAVDVNSWRHGIVVGLITPRGRVAAVKRIRPNLRKLDTLYEQTVKAERKLGVVKRLGLTPEVKRLRKMVKRLRRKLYRYLRDFANKSAHEVVALALKFKAKIVIDDVIEESRRELLEEGLSSGLAKLYLSYIRRFVKLLVNQARWYGLPVEFRRLYSTVCPRCKSQLEQRENRLMACRVCGFKADRDVVPILWTQTVGKP